MNFAKHFLLSTDRGGGSFFSDAVILLCKHDEDGAFGIVVNKPSPTKVRDLLRALRVRGSADDGAAAAEGGNGAPATAYISPEADARPVMQGGPVKPEQVFVLHSSERHYEATMRVDEHISVTLSRDILAAIAQGQAPRKILFAFGYAGWGEGQLEYEISENAWVAIPAAPDVVFDLPAEGRLPAALKRVGFDLSKLAGPAGNA